jgi:hypothetical protein
VSAFTDAARDWKISVNVLPLAPAPQTDWINFNKSFTALTDEVSFKRGSGKTLAILRKLRDQYAQESDSRLEAEWLAENRRNFPGEWIALHRNRLIAHSPIAARVFRAARDSGVNALVVQIEEDDAPLAGW